MAGDVRTYAVIDRVISFGIRTKATDQSHLVRLYNIADARLVMSVFVKGGSNQIVMVPAGRFIIKVASGKGWRGYDGLFGPSTAYMKMNTIFDFIHGYNYGVTLYTTPSGNLSTTEISKNDF